MAKVSKLSEFGKKIPTINPTILEIGGGGSGLTYEIFADVPYSRIITTDVQDFNGVGIGTRNLELLCDARDLNHFDNDSFDIITMFDVLEHIPNEDLVVSEARRVLKRGGYIFLQTPNNPWNYPQFESFRFLFKDRYDLMTKWGHLREGYSVEELKGLWKGFELVKAEYNFCDNEVLIYDLNHLKASRKISNILAKLISLLPKGIISEQGRELITLFQNEK